jgi:ATP-binding cassette, subfamily C (CFTR/MRP), member 1
VRIASVCAQEAAWAVGAGPGATWPETGALQLERLTLGYRAAEPALRDVTCAVAPGDKLGIVGRTGAGKSTLTLGLFRYFRPPLASPACLNVFSL